MGDLPYRIGPSQLGCRENPYGKTTAPNPDNSRVCLSRIDPRQRGIFNAAWTLGSIALLFSGSVSPNLLGMVMVVAQAIATGVFAELQYIGLRKSGGAVTA